jgi:hypothetical protein
MTEKLSDAHFEATAAALDQITDSAAGPEDPKSTLHTPSNHEKSHKWLKRIFPYDSLEAMESALHMGNYVIDRRTGQKTFEPMSIYVRVGMHALYYGSQQEKALQWKRTVKLLEEQSKKMGRQYDDPASVDHIVPFIESFNLQESMSEMKEPNPSKYKNFNEFFSREIREDARPIDEPGNVSFTFFIFHPETSLTQHQTGPRSFLPSRLPPNSLPNHQPRNQILDQRLRLHRLQTPELDLLGLNLRQRRHRNRPPRTPRLPPLALSRLRHRRVHHRDPRRILHRQPTSHQRIRHSRRVLRKQTQCYDCQARGLKLTRRYNRCWSNVGGQYQVQPRH